MCVPDMQGADDRVGRKLERRGGARALRRMGEGEGETGELGMVGDGLVQFEAEIVHPPLPGQR